MVDPLPKKCPRRKPFDFRAGFGVIDSACKTKENFLKEWARLANLLCFKGQALELLVSKIRTRGSFYLSAIRLGNSKTISKLNFEGLSTDSCSNNFSEIYLAYLKIPPPNMPDTGNAKDCIEFLPTNFSIFSLKNVTWRTYLISFPVQYYFLFCFVCKSLFRSSDFFKCELQYMFMVLWSISPPVIKKLM